MQKMIVDIKNDNRQEKRLPFLMVTINKALVANLVNQ